jgi:hypothetical protein
MKNIIYLKEAAEKLNVTIRTLKRWCVLMKVEIFSDDGCKKKYLIRVQFERARLRKIVDYLKREYKEKWMESFKAHMNLNLLEVIEMEENFKLNLKGKIEEYKPMGEHEKLFLTRLTKLMTEL